MVAMPYARCENDPNTSDQWKQIPVFSRRAWTEHLLLLLLITITVTLLGGLGLLSPDTAGAATTERRGQGEVDVLLRVEADDERGDVDDLLADAQVALQEVLDLEGQDVIELHAGLVEDTDAHETANESVTLEEALGVLLIQSEERTSGTTDLGQSQLDTPDLTLVAE